MSQERGPRRRQTEPRPASTVIFHSLEEAVERINNLNDPMDSRRNIEKIDSILKTWRGPQAHWATLNGLRVLDVASGSGNSQQKKPNFSRICALSGARVTAIDPEEQLPNDKQLFTAVRADLIDAVLGEGLKTLPELTDKEFDLIHSTNFLGPNAPREITNYLRNRQSNMPEFEQKVLIQAGELLTENGIMYLDIHDRRWKRPFLHTKTEGRIVKFGTGSFNYA